MTEGFPLEPAPPQPTAPAPRPRLTRPVATGLIGVLVGAFLVGVPWLVLSLLGGPSGQAPAAPANLGGLAKAQDAITKVAAARGKAQIDRITKTDQETAARVSAAYDGAGAVVQDYQDERLARSLQLIAVRAPSPELFAPYEDVQALGEAKPGTELVRVGAVQCLLHNNPAAPGSTPDPDLSFVMQCQRTGPGLTVTVRSMGTEGNHDPQELAGIVEQAWREVGS
ncbi:hypothetical protein [Amycolatopsis vastitatis]|uniref:Uncharacterized protein n=1 Tax=Amycolatopsis vastitatis TaxID=1905142 RepID=A0A229TFB8_9PSEU|nr:hypothetical protein [Amycolatopsis vastitatis]OXM69942.1 hypothetical protein CF165_06425 [Amycolatopsis vastitatis]